MNYLASETVIDFENMDLMISLFGRLDENIKVIEKQFSVSIIARDTRLFIQGEDSDTSLAGKVIAELIKSIKNGNAIDPGRVRYCISLALEGKEESLQSLSKDTVCITHMGKPIRCKTLGQKDYVNTIRKNDVVFGIGPAGTGKTFLAMAMAVNAFKNRDVDRIILTRPAVEAGEKLGFLPGDLQTKIDPYLRPLYDALHELMGGETYIKLIEKGSIEVAPLAYMRGRTLDNSFIILDEAQNTTKEQMKMLLTRIGEGSKAIINGDITQIDLPEGKKSGLKDAERVLKGVEGIGFTQLSYKDVVRHELVMRIIKAYNKAERPPARKK